jgi:diguanylate cyclase (GGDEF)-like protein/PAS domain S-box-containing protein
MPSDPTPDSIERIVVDNLADGVYYVDAGRKITYWNRGAERIAGFAPDEIVGHRCFDNLLDHVDAEGNNLCRGACPLAATIRDGLPHETALWLRHRDGHRKPVLVRTMPVRDAEGRIIGGVEMFSDNSAVLRAMEDADRARRDSMTDDLTGLPNRRHFDAALAGRLENLARYGWRFGLLIADVDFFKDINDEHGHAFGDAVLAGVGRTLSGAIRAGDLAARWGGDEFAILMESPDGRGIRETAERIQALLARSEARFGDRAITPAVSIGASMAVPGDTAASLFARADAALYAAKQAGRNRIETA